MSFWFTCTPTHHQKRIPWWIYGVMVCAVASEATACSLLSRWWIKVWLILRTVSETQTACVHSTEVLYPITTGGSPHMHAHTNATHIRTGTPPSVPVVCLLLTDKAGFYVRKRLVSEPGVQSEPRCLWWAVYMPKLLKDIKKHPLFASEMAMPAETLSKRCIDGEAFRTVADITLFGWCPPKRTSTSSKGHEWPWPFLHAERRSMHCLIFFS